ncbi:MAG: MlaD family protein [Deltaproteobacteria bacterium]|nr:MlaD family protein [Deltaproteobacteria bacterium]
MARRNSNFMIGLFVTAGVAIGLAAIVWLGASKYFEEGSLYVSYFDESVQGLQVDSRVKYRGVDIGKVQSIGVAPDHKLVEVVMKIDLDGERGKNLVTQLRAAGITGIVFIELDRRNAEDPILMPPSGMETRYPVIASQLSQTKQMLTSVDRIMSKIEQVDLKGISDQLKQTSRAVETFLSGKQMTGILAKLDSTAGSLDQGLRRIDRILAEGRVEGVLEEARQGLQESRKTLADARELVAAVRGEVKNLKASETADRAGRLLEGIDRRTRGMKTDFERTTDDIRRAAESLKLLLERLHANPSDLLFSRPPVDDGPQRGEVER